MTSPSVSRAISGAALSVVASTRWSGLRVVAVAAAAGAVRRMEVVEDMAVGMLTVVVVSYFRSKNSASRGRVAVKVS